MSQGNLKPSSPFQKLTARTIQNVCYQHMHTCTNISWNKHESAECVSLKSLQCHNA